MNIQSPIMFAGVQRQQELSKINVYGLRDRLLEADQAVNAPKAALVGVYNTVSDQLDENFDSFQKNLKEERHDLELVLAATINNNLEKQRFSKSYDIGDHIGRLKRAGFEPKTEELQSLFLKHTFEAEERERQKEIEANIKAQEARREARHKEHEARNAQRKQIQALENNREELKAMKETVREISQYVSEIRETLEEKGNLEEK